MTKIIERLRDEYIAHMFYSKASNRMKVLGYIKAGDWAEKESNEELEHADILKKFLTDWNVKFDLPVVPLIEKEFETLKDFISSAYELERSLYAKYNNMRQTNDVSEFTLVQRMIEIQRKSISELRTMLDRLDLVGEDKTSIFIFENETF